MPKATAYGDTLQAVMNIRNSKEFAEAREAIEKDINEGNIERAADLLFCKGENNPINILVFR